MRLKLDVVKAAQEYVHYNDLYVDAINGERYGQSETEEFRKKTQIAETKLKNSVYSFEKKLAAEKEFLKTDKERRIEELRKKPHHYDMYGHQPGCGVCGELRKLGV